MLLLEVKDLVKEYRSHWTYLKKRGGLSGVSFCLNHGECFGLLGVNGAGKTTTIKCILDLIHKTSGSIKFYSSELTNKSKISYLPEQPYFYQHLSVKETLELYAGLFGIRGVQMQERVEYVLEKLKISAFKDRRLKTLSKGQQQRVGIAQALINDPELLILDEPFSGLDPVARIEIKNLFRELKEQGRSLIISSHVLSEIETLCDRAVILKDGVVCREVSIDGLRLENPERQIFHIVCEFQNDFSFLSEINLSPKNIRLISKGVCQLEYIGYKASQNALNRILHKEIVVLEYGRKQESLEQVFVEINEGMGASSCE